MEKKISSIEGLRTLGWFGVFLCHFRGAFLPDELWITDETPLKFIYSGNAFVRLLFVISGFVLSYKYFRKEKYDNIFGDIVKRYFRLMPSVLAAELLVYILMMFGCLRNAEVAEIVGSQEFLGAFNQFQPDLFGCLKEALVTTYFNGASGYIGPLWTMKYEYLGAILILSALYILKKRPWRWLFYVTFLLVFNGYYNYFVLGMLICDLYIDTDIIRLLSNKRIVKIILISVGYLMFSMVGVNNNNDKYTRIIFSIGIVLFLLGILCSKIMEKVLGNRVMLLGGKLAYSAYIIHWPIIESFSCGLMLLMYNQGISGKLMEGMVFIFTFLAVIIAARFFAEYIEPIGARIGQNLID